MIIFEKRYNGESLYDLERDISDAIDPDYNEIVKKIPVDNYGFQGGIFKVTIEWEEWHE